ncbi:GNAT family N-acetyltransferase [Nocardioides campestrisoli]|uniref:GNAT family N-acetyltransferase n=1 Tax=Nocardioides campestrisoli TaxID=2736757 RepID=UPI00163D90C0|nr:GNAT family protein [Nocardioides campestrisoli]
MRPLGWALPPTAPGWPARLVEDSLVLRPIEVSDGPAWTATRQRNAVWLQPWEATVPPGGDARPTSFRQLVGRLRRAGREGTTMPFVIELEGRLVGQVTVNNIVRGSALFASVGYWLDQGVAGRGVMPRAVAMVIDHCFTAGRLHRIEICVRPENTNSLRVVEKLGLREVGYAPRFLHIDGAWRDHRVFAITAEEVPDGLLARVREG